MTFARFRGLGQYPSLVIALSKYKHTWKRIVRQVFIYKDQELRTTEKWLHYFLHVQYRQQLFSPLRYTSSVL